jgi:hypothetical protein
VNVTALSRTLDQELLALIRGVSFECLVCGEFVMRVAEGSFFCPECGSALRAEGVESAGVTMDTQAG